MTDRPPTDDERAFALAVLSRLRDGREVPAAEAASARELAARDPEIASMLAAWDRQSALLAGEPAVSARAGFTDRVLAALAEQRSAPDEVLVLPLVRRLAVAAALLAAVTLGWSLARPAELHAGADRPEQHHAVDGFRRTPFAPDDIEAGLRARKDDPAFTGGVGAERPR